MDTGSFDLKVPGGKLLRVTVRSQAGKVSSVAVNGDFFVHPEDSLKLIEESLRDCPIDEATLEKRARRAVDDNGIQLIGFTPADLAKAVVHAAAGARGGWN